VRKNKLILPAVLLSLVMIALLTGLLASCDALTLGDDNYLKCYNCLNTLTMASPDEGWAIGAGRRMLHYNNGKWQWEASTNYEYLVGIGMASPDEGWAVSEVVLHYHNGTWTQINALNPDKQKPDTFLHSVTMVTPGDGWAVGSNINDDDTHTGIIYHYDGTSWTQVATFPGTEIYGVAMGSPNEGWAVGSRWESDNTLLGGVILHYIHGQWAQETTTNLDLGSIAMSSPTEGWAVGSSDQDGSIALHYSTGKWTQVLVPDSVELHSVAVIPSGDAWAVGSRSGDNGVLLHYSAGAWSIAADLPNTRLYSVSLASATTGWALGDVQAGSYPHGILLHFTRGSWSVENVPYKPADSPWANVLHALGLVLAVLCAIAALAALLIASRIKGPLARYRPGIRILAFATCCVAFAACGIFALTSQIAIYYGWNNGAGAIAFAVLFGIGYAILLGSQIYTAFRSAFHRK
jgi:hypothetical protein